MPKKKYHLARNRQYFFYVLYNVYPDTMSQLRIRPFGISGMSVTNPTFEQLLDEISGLREMWEEYGQELQYLKEEKIAYLLFADNEDRLAMFVSILTLLRPSRLFVWLSFETQPEEFASFEPHARNLLGTFAEWEKLFVNFESKKKGDLFFLPADDVLFTNTLLRHFDRLYSNNKSLHDLLSLYARAYGEEKPYFKYLLFFMIIESLINDNDNNNLTYKIRRLCATLIGQDVEQCQSIFKGAGAAYGVRSKLVHNAKFAIERSYLLFVHAMVCEILLILLVCEMDANKVFDLSTQIGYGQRPALVVDKRFKFFGPLTWNSLCLEFPFPSAKKVQLSKTRNEKDTQ